jgi:hypothetical protein
MPELPQRPPRPDEEDLVRFHNGDTLDNIPVVRVTQGKPPRPPWLHWAAVVVGVGLLGGLAGAGVARLGSDEDPPVSAQAPTPSASPSVPAEAAPLVSSTPSTSQAPAPGLETTVQSSLEQVRIIQTPPTGGDPSSSYCLVYTGSSSGPEREAILLMNAPAVQCADLLPYDPTGQHPAFTTEAPICEAPSRAAVVSFAETGGWENEVLYTCLTEHNGA